MRRIAERQRLRFDSRHSSSRDGRQ
jgi:hypothetical protein